MTNKMIYVAKATVLQDIRTKEYGCCRFVPRRCLPSVTYVTTLCLITKGSAYIGSAGEFNMCSNI